MVNGIGLVQALFKILMGKVKHSRIYVIFITSAEFILVYNCCKLTSKKKQKKQDLKNRSKFTKNYMYIKSLP